MNNVSACNNCVDYNTDVETLEVIEAQDGAMNSRLNWLRAGVLGANDGIVSTAGLVVGVAGAAVNSHALFVSGVAGLVAGALSMAAGEFVSVSTQRDSERAALVRQRKAIAKDPVGSERKLAGIIAGHGVSKFLATRMASELSRTDQDAEAAHARFELGIDPDELTNPWHAALASMAAFALGAIIPLLAILLSPTQWAVTITVIAVSVSLTITGAVSAKLGEAPVIPATIRNIVWGNIAMIVTYGIGSLVGGLGPA